MRSLWWSACMLPAVGARAAGVDSRPRHRGGAKSDQLQGATWEYRSHRFNSPWRALLLPPRAGPIPALPSTSGTWVSRHGVWWQWCVPVRWALGGVGGDRGAPATAERWAPSLARWTVRKEIRVRPASLPCSRFSHLTATAAPGSMWWDSADPTPPDEVPGDAGVLRIGLSIVIAGCVTVTNWRALDGNWVPKTKSAGSHSMAGWLQHASPNGPAFAEPWSANGFRQTRIWSVRRGATRVRYIGKPNVSRETPRSPLGLFSSGGRSDSPSAPWVSEHRP